MNGERTVVAPVKPALGEPCNGCGACCLAMPCAISMRAFGTKGGERCPVLEWRDGRFWCGAAEMDDTGFVAWRLGIGAGCDSGDPMHMELARRMNEHHRQLLAARTTDAERPSPSKPPSPPGGVGTP